MRHGDGGSRGGVAAMAVAARAQGGDRRGGCGAWAGVSAGSPVQGPLVARSRRLQGKGQPWFRGRWQSDVRVVATPPRHPSAQVLASSHILTFVPLL